MARCLRAGKGVAPGVDHVVLDISAVAMQAREVTGRDLRTGEVADGRKVNNWLGALAYLVMLDQVDDCFEPTPLPRPPLIEKPIPKALT